MGAPPSTFRIQAHRNSGVAANLHSELLQDTNGTETAAVGRAPRFAGQIRMSVKVR